MEIFLIAMAVLGILIDHIILINQNDQLRKDLKEAYKKLNEKKL